MSETTPIDHSKEFRKGKPKLGALVDSALALFHSKHTALHDGNYFGYTSIDAAKDAILQSGFNPSMLFKALTAQTSFRAEEIMDIVSEDAQTKQELQTNISGVIVFRELLKAHPEIIPQDKVRHNWVSKSFAKSQREYY